MTDPGPSSTGTIRLLTDALLGESGSMNLTEVARRAGVQEDAAAARLRAFGYPEPAEAAARFTTADAKAIKAAAELVQMTGVDEVSADAFVRTVGWTFARLADWQVREILPVVLAAEPDLLANADVASLNRILKLTQRVHESVWRRHLADAASRLIDHDVDFAGTQPTCIGFVDMVGFTRRSRSLTNTELAALIDRFERVAHVLIGAHKGRVIKTIGDEVCFVVDDAVEAARLGIELADQHVQDPTFPKVRVGIAHGDLLHRLGDVLGPVVNMASRLTSVAPAGRVIIDAGMAELVKEAPDLRLHKVRRVLVKGFDPVDAWTLKGDRTGQRPKLRAALEDLVEDTADDLTMRVPQAARVRPDLAQAILRGER